MSKKYRNLANMLNDVRIGKIQPEEIEKVDTRIGVLKLPVIEIDESLNPNTSSFQLKRAQTTSTHTRSKTFDKSMNNTFDKSMNNSASDTNLKSMVKTFFSYNHQSACKPNKTVSDRSASVKSSYNIYNNVKSELLDHKPHRHPLTKDEKHTLEIE